MFMFTVNACTFRNFMPPPKIGGGGVMFSGRSSGCPFVRCPSLNTFFRVPRYFFTKWRDVNETYHRYHVSENC